MNLTKDVKSMLIGLFMGMSSADKQMLLNSGDQIGPEQGITNPVYSRNDFLRAIQRGQLSEEQLKWFYDHLDGMDKFHRNGGAMGASSLNEGYFKPKTDSEPGYSELHTFQNKLIENGLGKKNISTLTVLRDEQRYGTLNIEDYCTEVIVKKGPQGQLMAEFYCLEYKLGGNDLTEKVFEKLNGNDFNLQNFVQIKAFNVIRSTATRNAIEHYYKVNSFYKIKKIGDDFVIKFLVEELS